MAKEANKMYIVSNHYILKRLNYGGRRNDYTVHSKFITIATELYICELYNNYTIIILHAKTFSGFSLMIMKFIHIMYVRVSMQAHNSRGLYSSVCHIIITLCMYIRTYHVIYSCFN